MQRPYCILAILDKHLKIFSPNMGEESRKEMVSRFRWRTNGYTIGNFVRTCKQLKIEFWKITSHGEVLKVVKEIERLKDIGSLLKAAVANILKSFSICGTAFTLWKHAMNSEDCALRVLLHIIPVQQLEQPVETRLISKVFKECGRHIVPSVH